MQCVAPPGTYKLTGAVDAMAAAGQSGRSVQGVDSQSLSNTAWALAKLEYSKQAWNADCVVVALQPCFLETTGNRKQSACGEPSRWG